MTLPNLALRQTMPKFQGVICDPEFVPEQHRDDYLRLWGVWLRKTPLTQWEPWMKGLVERQRMKAKRP